MNAVRFNKFLNPLLEKIKQTFELFEWKWLAFPSFEEFDPSVKQIQMSFNKIFNELMADDGLNEVQCGHLLVRKVINDGEILGIEVMFELGSVYNNEEELELPIQPEEL